MNRWTLASAALTLAFASAPALADERILVASFHEGVEYLYRLVKALAGGNR